MWVRRKDVGFVIGGRENVGRVVGGEKRDMSSSVARGSGGSIGRYLFRTEDMVMDGDGFTRCSKTEMKFDGRASLEPYPETWGGMMGGMTGSRTF